MTSHEEAAGAASGAVAAVLKSTPPFAVAGLSLAGVPLQDWVYVLTLIWLGCQIVGWAIDRIKRARSDR